MTAPGAGVMQRLSRGNLVATAAGSPARVKSTTIARCRTGQGCGNDREWWRPMREETNQLAPIACGLT
jgi:hypothetical protein